MSKADKVRCGLLVVMCLGAIALWMGFTDSKLSRRETEWRNQSDRWFQIDFPAGTVKEGT